MTQHQITCIGCQQTLVIQPEMLGQVIQCYGCGTQMQIPAQVPQPVNQQPAVGPQVAMGPAVIPTPPATTKQFRSVGDIRVALILLIVGTCVLASSAGLAMLGELGLEIAESSKMSAFPGHQMMPQPPNPASDNYQQEIREHQRQMRDASQRMFQSRKRSSDVRRLGQGLHRFSRVLWLVGLGFMIAGFAVSIARFSYGRGLVIAALCVASVEIVLTLVLRVVPLFTDGAIRDHITLSVAPELSQDIGLTLLSLLLDFGLVVQFGLFALALSGLALMQHAIRTKQRMIRATYWIGGWAIAIFLLYLWLMINRDLAKGGWLLYLTWLLHWATNVALGFGFFWIIKFLIELRRLTDTQLSAVTPVAAT